MGWVQREAQARVAVVLIRLVFALEQSVQYYSARDQVATTMETLNSNQALGLKPLGNPTQ